MNTPNNPTKGENVLGHSRLVGVRTFSDHLAGKKNKCVAPNCGSGPCVASGGSARGGAAGEAGCSGGGTLALTLPARGAWRGARRREAWAGGGARDSSTDGRWRGC